MMTEGEDIRMLEEDLARVTAEAAKVAELRADLAHEVQENDRLAVYVEGEALVRRRLRKKVDYQTKLLAKLEWSGYDEAPMTEICPICGNVERLGHYPNCDMAAALKNEKGTLPETETTTN